MSERAQVEVEEARRRVLRACTPLPAVALELDAALGRVLAEDVAAEQPLPAFASSAMDGYAVRSEDVERASDASPIDLAVVGESRAGRPADERLREGQAVAISTGAAVPDGADAVVRLERTRPCDGAVGILERVAAGAQIRGAGEDVAAGERVLARGTPLGPPELGMLAALGRESVRCAAPPRLGLLVTGDELLETGEPQRPGAVRDSNSHSIAALARDAGAQLSHRATVKDEPAVTRAAIARAAEGCDVLVICGGVSVGTHDHVRPALAELGARETFWGLALRPGHPTWFGTLKRQLVFGLPGNPVSAMVTFVLLVAPALAAMQGARPRASALTALLDGGYRKPAGRTHAVRCRLRAREDGWHAAPTGPQGSHIISSMLHADALAMIPSADTEVPPGGRVRIEPLRPWPARAS
jgi:molybdopterin molybdotransferase